LTRTVKWTKTNKKLILAASNEAKNQLLSTLGLFVCANWVYTSPRSHS